MPTPASSEAPSSPDSLSVRSFSGTPRLRSPVIRLRSRTIHDLSPLTRQQTLPLNNEQVLDDVVDIIEHEEHLRWLKGAGYLVALVLTWVVSVQLNNALVKGDRYVHPLLMAALNAAFFTVYGIGTAGRLLKESVQTKIYGATKEDGSTLSRTRSLPGAESPILSPQYSSGYGSIKSEVLDTPSVHLSYNDIMTIGAEAAHIYFISCASSACSLRWTTASNQTIMTTTSSLFTLLLGVVTKVEKFSFPKLGAIIVSISGIMMITFADARGGQKEAGANIILGDLMALFGAFAYSAFLILLRLKLGEQTDDVCDRLVYFWLGLASIFIAIPVLAIAHLTSFERFALPGDTATLVMLLLGAFLNACSDYCASRASMLMSPLITSLSLSTAIPIAMLCDSFFYGEINTSAIYYLGIILIFSSFIFTNMSDEQDNIETAVGYALTEAVTTDPGLSPFLTPHANASTGPRPIYPATSAPERMLDSNEDVPILDIEDPTPPDSASDGQRIVVTGGHNGKYFIREVNL